MVKVSVIIPAYNAMNYLESTLNSVLQQSFSNFEVLIIDDGSKDHIKDWAKSIDDKRVNVISQTNQKVSRARNNGINQAKGEYIAFLDADDLWEETKLEKQVKYLEKHKDVGLVSTKVKIIDDKNNHIRNFLVPESERLSLADLLSYNYILCGSTPLIRYKCIEKVGNFDVNLNIAEDWDLWIRIAFHYSVAVILEYLVLYRQHSRNSSKNIRAMLNEIELIVEKNRQLVSPDLYPILDRRSRIANLNSAWAIMEEQCYRESLYILIKTCLKDPRMALSWSFVRLYFLIFSKKMTGGKRYKLYQTISNLSIRKSSRKIKDIIYFRDFPRL